MKTPITVAIVGKPNVGKSTLFNRILGEKYAITSDIAGTTRDFISRRVKIKEFDLLLVDTGGLESEEKENIEADVQSQAKIAIQDADIILFTLDLNNGLNIDDYKASEILRKTDKPIILIANKCDNPNLEKNIVDGLELGFGEAIAVSAVHNLGIEKLIETLIKEIKSNDKILEKTKNNESDEKLNENLINICVLGKPNAGKSSFVNAVLGKERVIVSETPGTTRDTTDTEFKYQEQKFNLIDTAGLRRRGKIEKGIEKYSSLRVLNGIERADIVVLMIDGEAGITSQDTHVVKYALDSKKGLLIAINKEDLLTEEEKNLILYKLRKRFSFVPWAPVIFISAKNRKHIFEILNISKQIMGERKKFIKTKELNGFMQKITFKHQASSPKIKRPKFVFISQVDINPPTFTIFFKNVDSLHFSYPRYIENSLRKEYDFTGTALNLKFKPKSKEERPEKN